MSRWPAAKAGRVLAALLRAGWSVKRESGGSHKVLERENWPDYVWAFHDGGWGKAGRGTPPRVSSPWLYD